MENNLIPVSPAQYAKNISVTPVTKASVCNWCRAHVEKGEALPDFVSRIERVGRAWLLYVPAEMVKSAIT